jgi:hypothetical protein
MVETLEREHQYLENHEKELLVATAELKSLAKTDESILDCPKRECLQEALDLYNNYQQLVTERMKVLEEQSEVYISELGKVLEVKYLFYLNEIFLIFYIGQKFVFETSK